MNEIHALTIFPLPSFVFLAITSFLQLHVRQADPDESGLHLHREILPCMSYKCLLLIEFTRSVLTKHPVSPGFCKQKAVYSTDHLYTDTILQMFLFSLGAVASVGALTEAKTSNIIVKKKKKGGERKKYARMYQHI